MKKEKKISKYDIIQAQVLWPADMPDNMLEDAISISKKALDENEFESNGVEVSLLFIESNNRSNNIDCKNSKNAHGFKMGALMARISWQVFWLPCCP